MFLKYIYIFYYDRQIVDKCGGSILFYMVSHSFLVIEDRSYAKFCPHIEFSIFFVLSKNREVTGQLPKLFTAGAFTR